MVNWKFKALVGAMALGSPSCASPTSHKSIIARQQKSSGTKLPQACLDIKTKQQNEGPGVVGVPLSQAMECVNSIPLDKKKSVETIDGLVKYYGFQSSLAFIKNPPKNYENPSVDIMKGLQDIRSEIESGSVLKEWDFEIKMKRLLASGHDGHLDFYMGLLFCFSVVRDVPLVALSTDGVSLPKIYHATMADGALVPTGDAVKEINGSPVVDFLQELSREECYAHQGADARFNCMLSGLDVSGNMIEPGLQSSLFMRPSIPDMTSNDESFTIIYEDGKKGTIKNTARWSQDLRNVTSIEDFYEVVVRRGGDTLPIHDITIFPSDVEKEVQEKLKQQLTTQSRNGTAELNNTASPHAAPLKVPDNAELIASEDHGAVGAYILKESSTAVLMITTFQIIPGDNAVQEKFVNDTMAVINKLLVASREQKVEKLIIDVQRNGGGILYLGMAVYKSLFPTGKIELFRRTRSSKAYSILAKDVSNITLDDLLEMSKDPSQSAASGLVFTNPLWLDGVLREDGTDFESVEELLGPVTVNGDEMSSVMKWDAEETLEKGGIYKLIKQVSPTFKPENILYLTDGICGSTCTILAELLLQEGAKTVSVGGIPRSEPMNAIGSVRGGQVFRFSDIKNMADFTKSRRGQNAEDEKILPGELPLTVGGQINALDVLRKGDPTPLQFDVVNADCRIFWTNETFTNPPRLWDHVADAFDGKSKCAMGSLDGKSSGKEKDNKDNGTLVNTSDGQKTDVSVWTIGAVFALLTIFYN